jgi:DNA (cytosine-5)-methyltransferase 1
MRNGQVFEHPMPVPRINDSESSFLQPELFSTVTVSNSVRSEKFRKGRNPTPSEFVADKQKISVPTPTVSDVYFEGHERTVTKESPNRGVGLPLWAGRIALLRTPVASEGEHGHMPPNEARASGRQVTLDGQARFDDWGQFAEAIARWEGILGLPAPSPTENYVNGKRLSSLFTEWMMGLNPGWVTGRGLSRTDELKLCGNGVVPQQAVFALSMLLERLEK